MRKIVSIVTFSILFVTFFSTANEVLVDKSMNRYYMLSKELEKYKDIDVQIYGSCHAYTSFDTAYFEEQYGVSAYNMANPSEIIPTTYLRMFERFKRDLPEVAVVEIWGVNAYETYIPTEDIMGTYLKSNVENIPISKEKVELIKEFETLNVVEDNFAIVKYKERLTEPSVKAVDFQYSFEKAENTYNSKGDNGIYNEMKNRFSNNGFKNNTSNPVSDYGVLQANVSDNESLAVERDIMKYIDKIIELCEQKEVELIFYRAPYVSTENELKKANYLKAYFEQRGVPFYDLEKEIEYSYETDFFDYQHLSVWGARKSTDYLGEIIRNLAFLY